MREHVAAVRAIWQAWETGSPLRFEGEHYTHTLMTPMFDHGPSPCGWPAIHVAAVGPVMTEVAGEVLDHHGWGALGDELHALSRRGEWATMGTLVDDDVLHAIAVVGDAAHVGAEIARRYGGIVDRIQLGLSGDDAQLAAVVDALRAAPTSV